jgi:hypothetical protein
MLPITHLIFVFAADSGLPAALLDGARKLLRLRGCTLCSITHGPFGERARWRRLKGELGIAVEYVHRDELEGALAEVVAEGMAGRLPCVVARSGEGLQVLLGSEEIDACRGSVVQLRQRLQEHARRQGLGLPGLIEGNTTSSGEFR